MLHALLSTHAYRQDVDISFTVCFFVFFCTVTDFSAEDKASGVKFCTAVHRRPRQGITNFCVLCSPEAQNRTNLWPHDPPPPTVNISVEMEYRTACGRRIDVCIEASPHWHTCLVIYLLSKVCKISITACCKISLWFHPAWGRGTPFRLCCSLVHSLPHLLLFITFSLFPFLIHFTYFPLLSIRSLSTRIVPLRFQARGRRRRPNLGLVCLIYDCVICIA